MSTAEPIAAACIPWWKDGSAGVRPSTIGVVPGEGIGPTVVAAALTVLTAVADRYGLDVAVRTAPELGAPGPYGPRLDERSREFFSGCFDARVPVLCGAVGGRFVYELRSHFDLAVKLVPVRPLDALADAAIVRPERIAGADVLIVRDNVGGLYQGAFGRRDGGRVAYQVAEYHADQVDRVLEVAARAAQRRSGHLAVVTKGGGIPEVSALWRERAARIATDVTVADIEVDNACFQLVADARRFDVVATPNFIGDVVADAAALVLGSRGMAVSANFGPGERAVYQTGHGAAYDLAGTDAANPVGQIHALAMLLRESFDHPEAASAVERAVAGVLASGVRTPDIADRDSTVVGTRELADRFADAVTTG